MILMITAKSIYLLDHQCTLQSRSELKDLAEIILVKASPCYFALSFAAGTYAPLILQSVKRTEIMCFILSKTEKMQTQKPRVVEGDALKVLLKSGGNKLFKFDDALKNNGHVSESQKRHIKSGSISGFISAELQGHLDKMKKNFWGNIVWERRYVVLSNAGLLWLKNPAQKFCKIFPILNSKFKEIDVSDYDGDTTVFQIESAGQILTFRAGSLTEYEKWTKAIKEHKAQTEQKVKTMKANELARILELQKEGWEFE